MVRVVVDGSRALSIMSTLYRMLQRVNLSRPQSDCQELVECNRSYSTVKGEKDVRMKHSLEGTTQKYARSKTVRTRALRDSGGSCLVHRGVGQSQCVYANPPHPSQWIPLRHCFVWVNSRHSFGIVRHLNMFVMSMYLVVIDYLYELSMRIGDYSRIVIPQSPPLDTILLDPLPSLVLQQLHRHSI